SKTVIMIGSLDKSSLIKNLANKKKIDLSGINGKWEAYHLQSISKPVAGVDQALVITGSDRRGTAFGVFELSKQLGVSPWYWWADVPVKKRTSVFIRKDAWMTDAPKVKYRGIF